MAPGPEARYDIDIRHLIHEEAPPFAFEPIEARIGNVTVGYTSWGAPQPIPDNGTGFTRQFVYPPDFDMYSPEAQAMQVAYGANMLEGALRRRKQQHVDLVIGASASSLDTLGENIADRLRRRGFSVGNAIFYGYYCNGGIGAAMDACRTLPHGTTVAIAAVESLSGNIINPANDRASVLTRQLFGNSGGYFIFTVGQDITHLWGRTVVIPDKKGVIKVPRIYKLPPKEERLAPLPGYEYRPGAEEIHAVSSRGSYSLTPEPQSGFCEMNGQDTLHLFSREGGQIIYDGNEHYYSTFASTYGPLGQPWMHQPSEPVLRAVERDEREHLLLAAGVDMRDIRKLNLSKIPRADRAEILKERKIRIRDPRYPWVMDKVGINNVSGATSLIQLTEMRRRRRIRPGVVTPVYGLAVSSIISEDYIIINPERPT